MDTPAKRKQIRMEQFDYATPGAYFITICIRNRENLFWESVGADAIRPYCINGRWFHETMGQQTNRKTHLAKVFLRSRNPKPA